MYFIMLYVKMISVKHGMVAFDRNGQLITMDDEKLTRDELLAVNWGQWMRIPTIDEALESEELFAVSLV